MTGPLQLFLQPGVLVDHEGERFVVAALLDVENVLLRSMITGQMRRVDVRQVNPKQEFARLQRHAGQQDLLLVEDDDWAVAQERFEIIRPLVSLRHRHLTRAAVAERAKTFDRHPSTLYNWMDLYAKSGKVSALLPRDRQDKGTSKLTAEVERILQQVIDDHYLTEQRPTAESTVREVQRRCQEQHLPKPHGNTVRNRIKARTEYTKVAARLGRRAAEERFSPQRGSFPGADHPLAVVQIDHTPVDVILVDDDGIELGRPTLTLALDVRTRMIAGYYLAFEAPNAFAVGMCLISVMTAKTWTLAQLEVEASWPLHGLPVVVHTDNAKEFHSAMLERACEEHHITLSYRPRGRPQFGGHVERMMDTLATLFHELPGTTFHNVQERGAYPSGKKAMFTLREFEQWLVTAITRVYHARLHTGLGTTPLHQYQKDILGDGTRPGSGIVLPNVDETRLRLDFLPFIYVTVQDYGLRFLYVSYYHDVLRRWINEPDPANPKQRQKFLVRYDPRDLSRLYFFDPQLQQYFEVPYRNLGRPGLSVWESRAATKHARQDGRAAVDEEALFAAYAELRRLEGEVRKRQTRRIRRWKQNQRQLLLRPSVRIASVKPGTTSPSGAAPASPPEASPVPRVRAEQPFDLSGFEEIEVTVL